MEKLFNHYCGFSKTMSAKRQSVDLMNSDFVGGLKIFEIMKILSLVSGKIRTRDKLKSYGRNEYLLKMQIGKWAVMNLSKLHHLCGEVHTPNWNMLQCDMPNSAFLSLGSAHSTVSSPIRIHESVKAKR